MSCYSTQLDLSLASKLKTDLEEQGFTFSRPPHTLFSAKKPGVSCTLYESGKLTVQGKGKAEFIEFYLEPELLAHLSIDLEPRIGMDEAGKGDFFGPLCVAAVYANQEAIAFLKMAGVKDSKELSDPTILAIAEKIRAKLPFTVIRLFPQKYNELYLKFKNLNRLLAYLHTSALKEVAVKTGCKKAILDQFADPSVVQGMVEKNGLEIDLIQKTKGESDLVVAAASILARAAFVDGIDRLCREVDFLLPKGASQAVVKAAQALSLRDGKQILNKVAKTHFKTMNEIA
jgi:ribonuclease HIII